MAGQPRDEVLAERLEVTLALAWHARTHVDPVAARFRALVREAVATPPTAG